MVFLKKLSSNLIELLSKKSVVKTWFVSYITVIIIMLVLVLWAGNVFMDLIVEDTIRLKTEEINAFSSKMDMLTEECKLFALDITADERFMECFTNVPRTSKEHFEIKNVSAQLRKTMKFVNDFFVYVKDENVIINSLGHISDPKHYYDIYYRNSGMDYDTWSNEFLNCNYSGYHIFDNNAEKPVERLAKFCYVLPLEHLYGKNVTVFTEVDSSSYESELSKLDSNSDMSVLIFDEKGKLYFRKGENIPQEDQIKEYASNGGFYESKISGKRVVMTITSSAFTTWKYAFAIPYSVFWSRLIKVRYIGFAIFALIAIMGIFGIYLITKYNYRAVANIIKRIDLNFSGNNSKGENEYVRINKMIDVVSNYSKNIEKQQQQERSTVVLKLLLGVVDRDVKESSVLLDSDTFVVAVFCQDDSNKIFADEEMSDGERENAVKLIISNIFAELLLPYGSVDAIDMDDMIFLFSPFEKHTLDAGNIIVKKAEELNEIASNQFKIKLMCGVSSCVKGLEDICIAYREALSAINTISTENETGVEVYSKKNVLNKSYYYPLDQMQYLMMLLNKGDKENAFHQISIIFEINSAVFEIENLAKALITDIAATIMKAALNMGYKIDAEKLMGCVKAPDRTIVEKIFRSYVNDICEFVENGHTGREKTLIEKIDKIIAENYTNTEFNVNMIADLLGVNANGLSVIYKRKTNKNILATIQAMRVNEAKRLLAEGDELLGAIAEKSGFGSNTTFRRVFKEITGVSPGVYREMKKK